MNSLLAKIAALSVGRIAVLGLILTIFYFFTFYDNGGAIETEMEGISSRIAEETAKKAETERILKKEEEMRADVATLAKTYENVKSKIPINFESSELRTIVEQISSASGLKISRFSNIDQVKSAEGDSLVTHTDANLVEKVAIEYTFQGNYSQLEKFMTQLASVEKIIKVSELKISTSDSPAPNVNLMVDAIILGYRQAALAQAPANKGATGAPQEAPPTDSGAIE